VFGKLLVLRDFLKLYGGFGPVFGPLFARTFTQREVLVLAGLGRVSRRRVSGGWWAWSGIS
jgi:hypothetical protein